MALAWLLSRPAVTAPIVGAGKLAHLEGAVGALGLELDAREQALLEARYVPHRASFHQELPGADQDL